MIFQEPSKPVIMAGMGTGLAPWRAVTQDRRRHQAYSLTFQNEERPSEKP